MQVDNTPSAPHVKICSKCGESKPATTEYFQPNKRYKDGFLSWCKACMSEYRRVWEIANKEKRAEQWREFYLANREQENERTREWYAKNKERGAKTRRAWKLKNKEYNSELNRSHRRANRERYSAYSRNRYALKRNAEGSHTAEDIQRQYKAQRGKCYYCDCKVGNTYNVDHVVPLSRGGSNDPSNLVIACPTCNQRKNNKLPHEWPEGGRLL